MDADFDTSRKKSKLVGAAWWEGREETRLAQTQCSKDQHRERR
jgi:hypothetical protein